MLESKLLARRSPNVNLALCRKPRLLITPEGRAVKTLQELFLDRPSRSAAVVAMLALACTGQALAQDEDEYEGNEPIEEITVTGTQIKGAAISEALAVSVFAEQDIAAMGISSGDELLDLIPEQGQNFQSEAENISGGVNSVRGDVGAFNLRNMGTGNTLVLLNGRRMVQTAGYQTELVGGSFVPVNSANPNEIPTLGVSRLEVLRDGASAIYGADAVVLVWVIALTLSGFVGLSTICAGIAAPLYLAFTRLPEDQPLFIYCATMALYLVFSHRSNIQRMRSGTENRVTRAMLFRRPS